MPRAHCKTPDTCRAPKKAGRCPCEVTEACRASARRLNTDEAILAACAASERGRPRIYPRGTDNMRRKLSKAGIKGEALRCALEAMV